MKKEKKKNIVEVTIKFWNNRLSTYITKANNESQTGSALRAFLNTGKTKVKSAEMFLLKILVVQAFQKPLKANREGFCLTRGITARHIGLFAILSHTCG